MLGFRQIILLIKSLTSALTKSGIVYFPRKINLDKSFIFYALNGTLPHTKVYKITPIDQISDEKPSYPRSAKISGDMYAGVPHLPLIISPRLMILLTPKSQILISLQLPSSSKLSSLKSRCSTPLECHIEAPFSNYRKKARASGSGSFRLFLKNSNISPPAACSITI